MVEETKNNLINNDEIDLRELLSILWNGKFKIIFITSIFAISSIYYALSIPNQYKASVVLAPVQSSSNGLSSSLSQLGGLASIAGVNIGGNQADESQISLEIMQSWSFIENFVLENNIAPQLYADKYDAKADKWLIKNEFGEITAPSGWELYKKFASLLSIAKDNSSGLVHVSVEYFSPEIAHNWLDLYIKAINQHMQKRKISETTLNIDYLEQQIKITSMAEMREVFFSIIEEQTKNKMLASVNPEYAFVTVSPSMVPEEKSKPSRSKICIIITLLGGIFSVALVLVMHYLKRSD